MKITAKHTRALITHVADVLGVQNSEAKATEIIRGMLGEEPSYGDLRSVDVAVVSEALRDVSVSVVAIRRAAIAKVFTFATEGARTCNRCGRFDVRLEGSTWHHIDGEVCPADNGLYVAERAPEPVIAWTDGRTYPAGTSTDAQRIPITEDAIREARRVDPAIDAALRETGATLIGFCAALAAEMHPASVLNVLTSPSARFVDNVALRVFAANASSAVAQRGSGGGTRTTPNSSSTVYDALLTLLPAQFEEIVFRLGVPTHFMPPASSPIAERATALVRVIEQGGRTRDLMSALARLGITIGATVDTRSLRNALCLNYDARDLLRVAADAGINRSRVDFSGPVESIAFVLIEEAKKSHLVEALAAIVKREYPSSRF